MKAVTPAGNPPAKREKFPIVVERGPTGLKAKVTIYKDPVRIKGAKYDSYLVVYYDMGERRRERFSDLLKAKGFAEEKATQLSSGEIAAVSLTSRDQHIYGAAVEKLRPFGVTLEDAVLEYTQARRILEEHSLQEAANFFHRYGRKVTKKGSMTEILKAMLDGLIADKRSPYHIRDIRQRVENFIKAHPKMEIGDVTSTDINTWLRSLKVVGRTRDNIRSSLVNFFNFARTEHYLPKDLETALDDTKNTNEPSKENEIYTVQEMQQFLYRAREVDIPTLAIKFFSGVRTEEMIRIRWKHFKFDKNLIFMTRDITKTSLQRSIPIFPNLKAWLEPYIGKPEDRVAERWVSAHTMSKAWTTAAAKLEIPYKRNAMRNSYVSYRVAKIRDAQIVAEETGNSAAVIKRDYFTLATPEESDEWFATMPKNRGQQ